MQDLYFRQVELRNRCRCLGVETKVKVLLAASGAGLTAKLCFATTDSNGGRCNWRAV